ncbi:MAG: hypothetical protein JW866_08435, partial [Ignavibacteriales bacterium]|nr:hypothetical protein [Ignavibacteriales bacterium]
MKNIFLWNALFLSVFLLSPNTTKSQWVKTNLGPEAQIGHSLYSAGSTIYSATLNGVFYTTNDGDSWYSIG